MGIAEDLLRGALLLDDAVGHEDHLIGDGAGEFHLMGDDDDGSLRGFQPPDHPQHLPGELRVQGGGGLVKAEDVRLQGQGPGDGHPLLLSAGELAGVIADAVGQAHLLNELPGSLLQLLHRCLFQQLGGQHHVFQHGILGEQVEGLEHQAKMEPVLPDLAVAEPLVVLPVEKGLAVHPDGAALGGFQEIQAAQQGGLAAAGGADDGKHLALFHGKGDVLQDGGAAEAFLNVVNFQYCHGLTL